MSKKTYRPFLRKTHRWLGLLLGIQFLMWTIGGLYFSWSDMDEIHGDHQKAKVQSMSSDIKLTDINRILDSMHIRNNHTEINDINVIQILNKPVYRIIYTTHDAQSKKIQLADATSGQLRSPLTKEEATAIAKNAFSPKESVQSVEYITETNGHHEYRDQPLPAYAITFNHSSGTTVYVSAEMGTVQKFRNSKWRIFDFLWMMHTMDFQSRDNISNTLLRAFSILGLFTVSSGLLLFIFTIRYKKSS